MRSTLIAIIFNLVVMVFMWGIFILSFHKDRSRYRNCYLLFAAIVSSWFFCLIVFMRIAIFIELFFMVVVLIVPYFLIHNGIVMIRREGRSLAHLLSLLLGILILVGEMALIVDVLVIGQSKVFDKWRHFHSISTMFSISVIYVSMSILIFVIYLLLLQVMPQKKNFNFVIIHGAGLIGGERVSKLLSDRIDKAILVYHSCSRKPKLIVSGGKGNDEKISEALAMKNYLLDKGIPEEDIILEDESTTTYENLVNSKRIIDGYDGEKNVALVSSNYHVYRALRYCRKIGFKCTGIGSRVAFYYWPSAVLREYIAVHSEKKHLIILFLGWFLWFLLWLRVFFTI